MSLRVLIALSVMVASAYGNSRGQNPQAEEDPVASLSRHNGKTRRLGMDYKKVKPLDLIDEKTVKYANKKDTWAKPQEQETEKTDTNYQKKNNNYDKYQTASTEPPYVAEEHQCVPFDDADVQGRASLTLTDDVCRDNTCGGCCRVYHWLICDKEDKMPQLPCVCNDRTRPLPTEEPVATDAPDDSALDTSSVSAAGEQPALPAPTEAAPAPAPAPANTPANKPAFYGGADADACTSGSVHHNNPLFRDFTKCFGAGDCPLASECCIHSFCFCGQPDDWSGDCVAPVSETGK